MLRAYPLSPLQRNKINSCEDCEGPNQPIPVEGLFQKKSSQDKAEYGLRSGHRIDFRRVPDGEGAVEGEGAEGGEAGADVDLRHVPPRANYGPKRFLPDEKAVRQQEARGGKVHGNAQGDGLHIR